MSLTTIESLNKDVLLDIFDYLDSASLKNSAKVCKNWNDIIGSSSSTMRKLPLILRHGWYDKLAEVNKLRRQHHTILLDSFTFSQSKLMKVIENIGSNVRQLEFEQVKIAHPSFPKTLSLMPMLEQIVFCECTVDGDEAIAIKKANLKKLKKLVFVSSDFKIFGYFTKSQTQVQELKIATKEFDKADEENFQDFLKIQTDLTTLAIRVSQGGLIRSLATIENKFKLKNLAIDFKYWGNDPATDEGFIKFLEFHQSTLENLETEKHLSENIVKFIMQRLKLKRVIVNGEQLKYTPHFFNSIRPNAHMKTLVIEGGLTNLDVARGLLNVYSSVEKLSIKGWNDEIINDVIVFIANHLKRLQYLEIPSLAEDTPELAIPTLKTFQVDYVENVNQWQAFLMNNPSLETVAVQWIPAPDTVSYEILNAITQRLQKMRHMKFGAKFKPTQRILEMMQRNCPKLHLLETFNADPLPGEERNSNTNVGSFKVIFYPHEAVTSVFKAEQTIWTVENHFDLELESDDEDDEDDDMMSWADDDETDRESDFDYVDEDALPDDDGLILFGFHF